MVSSSQETIAVPSPVKKVNSIKAKKGLKPKAKPLKLQPARMVKTPESKKALQPAKMQRVAKQPMKAKEKVTGAAKKKADDFNGPKFTQSMVTEALSTLKERKGFPLVAIRKYIVNKYAVELDTRRLNAIKKIMMEEFQEGRLQMVNSNESVLKFNVRYKYKATNAQKQSKPEPMEE